MFDAVLLTTANSWRQPARPLTDEWIKKTWYLNTVEHYWAFKNKEILPFSTSWMKLEGIRLSEISQTRRKNTPNTAHIRNLK